MKRGIFILTFVFIGFLSAVVSPAWGSWQYVESETETTTTSTSYVTKVQTVVASSGYHLIMASWELGINDTASFALCRVMRNSTAIGDYSLQTFDGSSRFRDFAFHSILSLTAGDTIKITYATNNASFVARIKRARIALLPLTGMEYGTTLGMNMLNLNTNWVNASSVSVTPTTAGDYLVLASVELKPNSTIYSGECRVDLDGATTWDLATMEGKSTSDKVSYFSARIVNLSASAHTLRLQAHSDEDAATDITSPRISVIRLTNKFNDFSQGEQLGLDSTTNGADNWVNRLTHVHTPFQPGSYLVLGRSHLNSIPDTSVIPENRWTLNGQEQNKFIDVLKDSTDFLPLMGFRVFSWNGAPETLKVDFSKNSSGSQTVYIRNARIITMSEQLYTGFPVLDSIGPKSLVEGDTLRLRIHAKDPLGDSLILSALNVPAHAVFVDSGNGSGSFVFPPAFNQAGVYSVTFIARDTSSKADSEVVLVTVTEFGNHAPVLDSIGPKSLAEGDTLKLRIHATDLDLDSVTLRALNVPLNAVFVDSGHGSGSFVFTPSFAQSGIYNVTFKSTDTLGAIDSEVVQITVNNFVRAPVLDSIGPKNVNEAGNLSFRIHAVDPDGDSIILSAVNTPANAIFVDSGNGSGSFVFNPDYTQAGVYYVTFTSADTFSAKDSEIVAITVNNVNRAPVLDSIGPKSLVEGDTLKFRIHAGDLDLDSIILSALNVPLHAVFVDSGPGSGSFVFTPSFVQSGIYNVTFKATDTLGGVDSEVVQITVTEFGNHAPVLDSIGPKSLAEGDTLRLRIQASDLDLDSIILTALNVPLNATFVDSGNGSGSFVFTPNFAQSGIYNVILRSGDTLGGVDSEVVQITVNNVVRAPVLDSIGPKNVNEGENLSFRIHATDPDDDSIILNAVNTPANAIFVDSTNGAGSFIFNPDFTQAGVYYITFTSADTFSAKDSEIVAITVNNVNRAPVLDSIGPKSLVEGDTLRFRIHAGDLDLDSIILSALNVPLHAVFVDSGPGSGSFVFTPSFVQSGIYNVTIKATDTLGGVDSEVVQITVTEYGNHAPVLDSIGPKSLVEGDTLRFRIHATDLDLDSIILSALNIPLNATFVDSGNGSGSFVFTPNFAQSGIYNVTLKAGDTLSGVDSEVVQITVTEFGNHTPVLDLIGPKSLAEGDTLRLRIHASDLDLDSVILSALSVPLNAAFVDSGNGAGFFVFTPSFAQSGIYNVTFKATDTLSAVDSEVVQITVNNVIRAPVLDSIGPKNVDEGGSLSFRIHAADPDGDSIILHAVNTPANAVFVDSGNGAGSFVFNPSYTQAGVYHVTFTSADTFSAKDSEVVTITVNNVNRAPVMDSIGPKSLAEGDTLRFRIHATDMDLDSIILTALNVPLNAIFVDSGHGSASFVFTPSFTQSGIYNVTFRAGDTLGGVDSEVVQITVNNVNGAPVLDSIGAKNVNEGGSLSFRIHTADPDGDSIILHAFNTPANAIFVDSGNGAGSLVFNPDYTQSGVYHVTFTSADTFSAKDSEVVAITVNNVNRAPVLDLIGPKSLAEGDTLRFRIHAADLDLDSIILSALNIPLNATFVDSGNGSGSFVFTPSFNQSGIYNVTFKAGDTLGGVDSEIVQITVNNVNRVPVLDSIGPKSLAEGDTLRFRIYATDVDLDSIVLSALNVPLNAVLVDSGNGAGSFVFTPSFAQSGIYNVTFKTGDTLGGVDSEVVQITVNNVIRAPVLDSIGPKNVNEGGSLSFRIHAADPDGDSIILHAVNTPTHAVFVDSGNGTGSLVFNPDYTQSGVYHVTFTSADTFSAKDSEVVVITVNNVDRAPVLDSIGPKNVNEGGSLRFRIHASDPDGNSVILSAMSVPTNATFVDSGNGAGSFTFNPNYNQAGLYYVTFKVSDGALIDSEIVSITVNNVNREPVLNPIGPRTVIEGGHLGFIVTASDPDGDSLILSALNLPAHASLTDSGNGRGVFEFDPDYTQSGIYHVTFKASDLNLVDSEVVTITVIEAGNQAPVLDSIGPKTVAESQTLRFRVHAIDPDGNFPAFLVRNKPTNSTFVDSGNGSGSFTFNPSYDQAGIYLVTFVSTDGSLQDSERVQITVTNTDRPPVLDSIGLKVLMEGDTLKFRVHAADPDNDSLRLTVENLPLHASFTDSGNGAGSFRFTPDFTQSGVYNVRFMASDGVLSDSEMVQITVNNVANHSPVLDSIGPKVVDEGQSLRFRVKSTDIDGDSIVLSARNVPTNATFVDSGNGAGSFSFNPDYTQSGLFQVTFIASDGSSSDSEVVSITVNNVNRAPALDSIGPKTIAESQTLQFRIFASDPDADSVRLSAKNIPLNATFTDSGNGAGLFIFNPNFTQSGIYNVTFIASDGSLLDSEVVQITVTEFGNHAPALDSIGPKSLVEGDTLKFRIHAVDTDLDSLILQASGVPLNGTFIDSGNGSGAFVFTPSFIQSGIYSVTFIASDGFVADSEVVSITVTESGNHAPVLDSIGPKMVAEGSSLQFRIHATDIESDSIILQASGVPLNGTFVDSGNGAGSFVFNPDFSQSGIYHVTFKASDGSLADSEVVQITVSEFGNHAPALDSIGPKMVAENGSLQFRIHATDIESDSIILQATGVPLHGTLVDSGNGAGSFVFNPDFSQSGIYNVTFVASDGSLPDSEVVQITVTEFGNHAPVLDSIGSKSLVEGDTLKFRIHAVDMDLDSLILQASGVPLNGTLVDSGNGAGSFIFKPSFIQSGIYSVTFIASDGFVADSEVVQVTVTESGNHAPVLDSIGPKTVVEGNTLQFRIHAVDVDIEPIFLQAYGVPNHGAFVDSGNGSGSFVFTPDFTQSGTYYVTFLANDTSGTVDSERVQISVIEAGNHAPVLDSIGPKIGYEKQTLRFRIHATDVDLDHISLSASSVPSHASFVDSGNGAGAFTFIPDSSQSGIYHVTFKASDASLADSENVEITVMEWSNHAPVLDSIGPKISREGDSLVFTVSASDSDGTIPVLGASNLPDHATFVDNHNGHGTFKFYPTFYQAGVETVTFTAIDMSNPPPLSDFENVVITITDVNQPPTIDTIGPKTVQAGHTLNFRVVGHDSTDPDGGPLHMTASGLPANSAFHDSGGGVGGFTFTPDYSQVGVDTVIFFCTDEGAPPLSGYKRVQITVTQGADRPPVLDAIGFKMVTEGHTLSFRVHATDPDGTTPMLYTSTPIPQNATFVDSGNGAGSFLFTPSYVQSGLYQITFYASDGELNDYEQVMIQVVEAGNQAPILDSIRSQSIIEGDSLKLRIHAIDPEGNPITLSLRNNPINSSLVDSGNGSGLFRFKPSYVQSGIYAVTFKATDNLGKADSEIVQVTVIEAGNQAPILDSIGPKTVKEWHWLSFVVKAADPDSNVPVLRASNLPPTATFTDNHNGTGSFLYRPDYYAQGVYHTLFEAVDSVDTLLKDWEQVDITVTDSNQYPVATAFPDSGVFSVKEGQTCQFQVIGTDPDSTIPVPHVKPLPANATFIDSGNGVGLFTFTPGYNQGGYPQPKVYTESLFVVDQLYPADTAWARSQQIRVFDTAEPPNIAPINDTSIVEGIILNIHVVTSSTVDIPTLQAVGLPTNSSFVDSGNGRGGFRFSPDFNQGNHSYLVRFIARSRPPSGPADTEDVNITVTEWGNHPPVLDSIGPKLIVEEQVLSFRVHATDLDHDPITLIARNVPTNATFVDSANGAGSFVFHPNWTQSGVYYVTFIASDSLAVKDSEIVQITVQNVDQTPVLDPIGSKTVAEGGTLRFRVHATDVDSDSLVFTAAPLPRNTVFVDSGNGAGSFTFTPDYFQAGVYSIYISVSDLNSSDMEMVPITVTNVAQPPILDSIRSKSVMEGDSLKFRIHAIDSDGDHITLSVRDNPGNSTLIDSGNGSGLFRFYPTYLQDGVYILIFKATDATGKADSERVVLYVGDAGNQPPVLVSLSDTIIRVVGKTDTLHIYATDPDGPTIILSALGLPAHSAFADSGNGEGLFTFTPDSTQKDSIYYVNFIASDGFLADSEMVKMHVIFYVPGDANGDKQLNLGDIVYLINYLYKNDVPPNPMNSGDPNGDCKIDLGDIVYLINYLYKAGDPPVYGCVQTK